MSVGEVVQTTGIPRSTVAPTLSRLVTGGLIARVELPVGGAGYRATAAGAQGTDADAGATTSG